MWQLLIGFVGKQGHLSRISYYDIGFSINPARFEGATAVDEVVHLNGSTISMTPSILPVSVPSAGQKLQIPCVSRMARTSNGGKKQIYCVSNYVVPGVPQSTNEALANMDCYGRKWKCESNH